MGAYFVVVKESFTAIAETTGGDLLKAVLDFPHPQTREAQAMPAASPETSPWPQDELEVEPKRWQNQDVQCDDEAAVLWQKLNNATTRLDNHQDSTRRNAGKERFGQTTASLRLTRHDVQVRSMTLSRLEYYIQPKTTATRLQEETPQTTQCSNVTAANHCFLSDPGCSTSIVFFLTKTHRPLTDYT